MNTKIATPATSKMIGPLMECIGVAIAPLRLTVIVEADCIEEVEKLILMVPGVTVEVTRDEVVVGVSDENRDVDASGGARVSDEVEVVTGTVVDVRGGVVTTAEGVGSLLDMDGVTAG